MQFKEKLAHGVGWRQRRWLQRFKLEAAVMKGEIGSLYGFKLLVWTKKKRYNRKGHNRPKR